MGAESRSLLAARMSDELRALSRAGLQHRNPGWTAAEVELELRRLIWGDKLFREVYPDYSAPG